MHHAVLYDGVQRVFTAALDKLLRKPQSERTEIDSLQYKLLIRGIVLIDVYHNILNCGLYEVVEMILRGLVHALGVVGRVRAYRVCLRRLRHRNRVFEAMQIFFEQFGLYLHDRGVPWNAAVLQAVSARWRSCSSCCWSWTCSPRAEPVRRGHDRARKRPWCISSDGAYDPRLRRPEPLSDVGDF